MKNIFNLFTNINIYFIHKLIACVVFACIIFGSIEYVPAKYDFSFLRNMSVSADTAVNHFFSLATNTMAVIANLFMQAEQLYNEKVNPQQTKKENKTKQEKTSKEASGFSIIPAPVSFSFLNKGFDKLKYAVQPLAKTFSYYKVLVRDFARSSKEFILLNIMLFILMMFLIKKNTSSDNYGNIKLNNNRLAWLVV